MKDNKEYYKKYREKNREKINQRNREYYALNKEKVKEKNERSRQKHIDRFKETAKRYYAKNKESLNKKARECAKRHYKENPKKYYESIKKSRQKRFASDNLFVFVNRLRVIVSQCFNVKNYDRAVKTVEILGCSIQFFKSYIENRFEKGMTWGNRGEWHLDHIIPISSAKTKEEAIKLSHYTNFQPLWKRDNVAKRNNDKNEVLA